MADELKETPESKAKRWLASAQKFVDYCKTPGADPTMVKQYREKFPFVAWLLDNPDLPPEFFFYTDPPTVPKPPVPWEEESPGMPKPDTNVTLAEVFALLKKVAQKVGA